MRSFLLLSLCLLPLTAFAAEVSPTLQGLLELLSPVLGTFAAKYPWLATALTVMLYARIIVKPVMSALSSIGENLPDGKVRTFLRSMSDHTAYRIVAYLLDWFASIKLPQKKK